MTQSAVIVPVPEAEPVVGELRGRLDPAARWGVPAHVTVIFPFLPPDRIGDTELHRLRTAVASVPRFDVTLGEVRWFDEDVVWLAPEPASGFLALTRAVWSAFPECPPYGGAYADSVPHLTVGHGAPAEDLRAAATAAAAGLPISARVETCGLFVGDDVAGGWRPVAALPLG